MKINTFANLAYRWGLQLILAAGLLLSVYGAVYADALTSASLTLSDPRTTETATYTFGASGFSGTAECITLEFNTEADGSGSVPTGLTSTGASLDAGGTMITEASWTEDFTANGTLELTFTTGETPSNGTLVFTDVVNGSTDDTTYYALFTTYSDDTCSTAVDSVTVAYLYSDGKLVSLTIEPTLTFTTNAVNTATAVNGATTTVTSTATAVDFTNTVTASANGVSAHRLDVSTNANSGYVVYIRHTGLLTNGAADTITAHTGTNATPTSFSAAGTESWGYTTTDSDLTGGTSDRFTTGGGDLWAGFTTTNQPVMDNPGASSGTDQVSVGHQVGIAGTTETGTYTTTMIYTIVATY